MSVRALERAGGWIDIVTDYPAGMRQDPIVLVTVRPVGTLDWGEIASTFSAEWVLEMIEALKLAKETAENMREERRT